MSEFETLHAQLAENLDKRKTLVRSIIEMEREYLHDRVNPDLAIDQITDWKFDLFILNKEANRIMRKMFKIDPHQAAELEDLSTD
jgi:hypothetical protein